MIGTTGFIGKRLTEALEARGMTATALANILGITPVAISQYVKGRTSPKPEVMREICQKLNLPEAFFRRKVSTRKDDEQEVFWRSFASATKTARVQSARRFRWMKDITAYLSEFLDFPEVNLPWFDCPTNPLEMSLTEVEILASKAREFWGLGNAPISDLLLLIENNGIIVSRHSMGTETIDAFSQWSDADKLPYLILASDKQNAVRSRYDAGHELAHLLLHRKLDNTTIRTPIIHKVLERQAFRFSAAFLLPSKSFLEDLWAPTLDAFRALKERWKISIGVMIKRCEDLEIITEDQARRLWMNYNRRGWRIEEPLDDILSIENPRLLRRSIELLVKEAVKSKQAILDDLAFSANDIEDLCGLPPGFLGEEYEPVVPMPRLRSFDNTSKPSTNTPTGTLLSLVKRN